MIVLLFNSILLKYVKAQIVLFLPSNGQLHTNTNTQLKGVNTQTFCYFDKVH